MMNHYYKIALACLTVMLISTPAMARGSKSSSSSCARTNATPAEVQNCLARMNSPTSVRARHEQEKRDHCEQNAKNRGLQGGARSHYISTCMNENPAAATHTSVIQHRPAYHPRAQAKSRTHHRKSATRQRRQSSSSCVARANRAHLKGSKRRHFLKNCGRH